MQSTAPAALRDREGVREGASPNARRMFRLRVALFFETQFNLCKVNVDLAFFVLFLFVLPFSMIIFVSAFLSDPQS